MHQSSRTELSPDDAFLIEVSTHARRYARRFSLLGDSQDADDIAQDVVCECLIALRNGKGVVIATNIASFVRTMVLRRLVDALRADTRRHARDEEYMHDLADQPHVWMSPEMALEAEELDNVVHRAIASLPPVCRRVYLMIREDGHSYQEVAQSLGISPNTVREHLVDAQRRLRIALAGTLSFQVTPRPPLSCEAVPRENDLSPSSDEESQGRTATAA